MSCRPGMVGCRRSCLHRASIYEYYAAVEAWQQALDAEKGGESERDDFRRRTPRPTLGWWLEQTAARRAARDADARDLATADREEWPQSA